MAQAPHAAPHTGTRSSLSEAQTKPADAKEPETGQDTTSDEKVDEKSSPSGPVLLSGPTTPTVRITNIYVQGGPNSDVQVTKTAAPTTVLIPTGHSALFTLSDAITAIASVASTSGATSRTPVDIG